MEIIISGRHLDVNDRLKAYNEEKLFKLSTAYPKLTSSRTVLDQEKAWYLVEITLHGKNINMVATARTEDMYVSLDQCVEKLEKQLHKFLERVHDHRPHGDAKNGGKQEEVVEDDAT